MVGETNSMVDYKLRLKAIQFSWGSGGCFEPLSRSRVAPWWGLEFFDNFLNVGLQKMFEKLKIDTF